jgi:hypothetical protein
MEENTSKDFVFRYPLSSEEVQQSDTLYDDRLVELFRQQLINLLDVVELTYQGEVVKVDGFAFLYDPRKTFKLFGSK